MLRDDVDRAGHRSLVAMPLFHVGGSCYAQVGIHGGARTILLRARAGALFGAIASGATHTFVVPTVIHGVLAAGGRRSPRSAPWS